MRRLFHKYFERLETFARTGENDRSQARHVWTYPKASDFFAGETISIKWRFTVSLPEKENVDEKYVVFSDTQQGCGFSNVWNWKKKTDLWKCMRSMLLRHCIKEQTI